MFEAAVRRRLATADIVPDRGQVGDPSIANPQFWRRVALGGSLALGESYMDGDWSCTELDAFFSKLMAGGLHHHGPLASLASAVAESVRAAAHRAGARDLGERHYDISNEMYAAMLGPTMAYTCAYWPEREATLEEAQEAKFDLVCRKLGLRPGMSLLDIGCGWGSLLKFAAEHYGIRGTGITVSSAQAALARDRCAGLPVTILLRDYRDIGGRYDRIATVGMFEHVERRFHRRFMEVCRIAMKPDGIGLLHTIGKYRSTPPDPWIRRHIFPLGDIPMPKQILSSAEELVENRHWHALGGSQYDRTLMAWHRNFESWAAAGGLILPEDQQRFYRMWRYYLLACAGAFRAGCLDVWQMVFTRTGDDIAVPDLGL